MDNLLHRYPLRSAEGTIMIMDAVKQLGRKKDQEKVLKTFGLRFVEVCDNAPSSYFTPFNFL